MGSNPIPRTTMLKLEGGSSRGLVLAFSEDFVAVVVADVFEASVYQCADVLFGFGYFADVFLFALEQFFGQVRVYECVLYVLVAEQLHDV